jgi:hypothetical protein
MEEYLKLPLPRGTQLITRIEQIFNKTFLIVSFFVGLLHRAFY